MQRTSSAFIITAENDVLRDEGEAYGRKLISAGVEVVTTRYNATIHDFVLLNALAQAAPTRAAVMQAVAFLKKVFAHKKLSPADGNATVVNSRLPKGVETKTFAITVEPEDGSQLPTSTPIMLGTGG